MKKEVLLKGYARENVEEVIEPRRGWTDSMKDCLEAKKRVGCLASKENGACHELMVEVCKENVKVLARRINSRM